ncbi:MAG: hypothetical protein E7274_03320 [Pseudobutyrivibrio ruminis]|jgi:hypothetical protein|uniref:hypothetical protein n=1 Tax=Pseudobutyrivibrio ruminis TaxID=46206 RepID=UPI0026F1DF37|nr:hypothetical protein [Pseudobutyrivibrio ruminis]MBE5913077.1 hypothetical protein [Pseudobutyrivibrio ruminis]
MRVRDIFREYYGKEYKEIEEKSLIGSENGNTNYVISSFDNIVSKIYSDEERFKYYTIQRTFRTKPSHEPLWGKDSFLLPFNIMMSTFCDCTTIREEILKAIFFLRKLNINPADLVYVCTQNDKEIVDELKKEKEGIKSSICVNERALAWKAIVNGNPLEGHYLKIYKRHYTGFVLVVDCTIINLVNRQIVDISYSELVLETLNSGKNTIYECRLLDELILKNNYLKIGDRYKFCAMFISIMAVLIDGGIPSASKLGSPIRKLIKNVYYEIYGDINLIINNIDIAIKALENYEISTRNNKELYIDIWKREFVRIENINRQGNEKLVECFKKLWKYKNCVYDSLKFLEDTYGIDHRYSLEVYTRNFEKEKEITMMQFEGKHPTCAIPLDISEKDDSLEFLSELFAERL